MHARYPMNTCTLTQPLRAQAPCAAPARPRHHLVRATSQRPEHISPTGKQAKTQQLHQPKVEPKGEGFPRAVVHEISALPRRSTLLTVAAAAPLALSVCPPAEALSDGADRLWEAIGGGPPDLYYPEEFFGTWQVVSTLVDVDVPMGEELLTDSRAVQRAKATINQPLPYMQRFVRAANGKVIADRPFNIESLTTASMGGRSIIEGIEWDPENPNVMRIRIPGSSEIFSRVTKRFQEDAPAESRLSTSEVVEQVFPQGDGRPPRIKASRCLTKYKWRSEEAARGGPVIVGTQIVSDFVTDFDNGISADRVMDVIKGTPAVVYTYRIALQRPAAAD